MKKLMTMLAAAAMAFGLYAGGEKDDHLIAGADFEATPVTGNAGTITWNGSAFVDGWWEGATADMVVPGTVGYDKECGVPLAFTSQELNDGVMKIATTLGNPIKTYTDASKDGVNIASTGLYFDGLVNFTVFDKDDTPAATDAKLAVFLQLENDDDSETNFIVRAAGPNNTTNDFVCADADLTPGWHRLTIKMIDNVYKTGAALVGFVVYVDGSPVSYTAANPFDTSRLDISPAIFNMNGQLFASLEGADKLVKYVAFDGQGQIDDIAFTESIPSFAGNKDGYVAMWDKTKVDAIEIGGAEATDDELALGQKLIAGTPAGKVTVVWTAKTGYVSGNGEYAVVDKVLDLRNVVQEATVEVTIDEETTGLADLAAAVAAINASANGGTITLKDDQTVDEALVTLAKDTVLDLNGETITFTATGTELALASLFTVANGVALTIKDSGEDGEIIAETTTGYTVIAQAAEESTAAKFAVESGKMSGAFASWSWAEGYKGITGGQFLDSNSESFYLAAYVDEDMMPTYAQGYWTIVDKPEDIDLAKAVIVLTANSIVYGEEAPTISSITVDDKDVPTDAYTPSCNYTKDTSGIGTYAWTVTAVEGKGYTGSKTADFTVTAKAATVTVDAGQTKVFGAVDPNLTAKVTGLVGADTLVYTVTREAGENVGTYAITAAGEATQGNYTVTYVGDNFTITEKALTDVEVTLTPETATFDSTKTDPADYTIVFVSSATDDKFALADCSVTWDPTTVTAAGDYKVTVAPKANGNYSFTAVVKTLTINPAAPDRPSDVESGSPEQKAAYDQWAKDNDITGTAANNAVAFALDVTKEDIGEGTIEQAIEKKLDAAVALTAVQVAALTTGETPAAFKLAGYPNAQFLFVETTDIQSATGKFFRLTAVFQPANND